MVKLVKQWSGFVTCSTQASEGAAASRDWGLAASHGGGFPVGWQVWSPKFFKDKFLHFHTGFRNRMVAAFWEEVSLRQAKVSKATSVFGLVCMVRGLPMLSVLMSSWRSYGNLWAGLQAFGWGVDWLWLELCSLHPHRPRQLPYKGPPWKKTTQDLC